MISFFTKTTVIELVDTLTTTQLERETVHISNMLKHDIDRSSRDTMIEYLRKNANMYLSELNNVNVLNNEDLNTKLQDIQNSINIINDRINMDTPNTLSATSADISKINTDNSSITSNSAQCNFALCDSFNTPTTEVSNINGITKPYELLQNVRSDEIDFVCKTVNIPYLVYKCPWSFSNISIKDFDDLEYSHTLNRRNVAYFGQHEYGYSGATHKAKPISSNTTVENITNKVRKLFPSVEFNSVLINKYSDLSKLPPHSDDEPSIVKNSAILCLSIGADRSMTIRRKGGAGEYVSEEYLLSHGDMMIMSQGSQVIFDHGIPATRAEGAGVGTRISLTFRLISEVPVVEKLNKNTRIPRANSKMKRVLILSDSRNLSFDANEFKFQDIVCFKETCYTVNDIIKHESQISKSDVVILSCGVNDFIKQTADPVILSNYLRGILNMFAKKYPETFFLFYTVSPCSGYKYIDTNSRIAHFNDLCFELSLDLQNFRIFENLFFNESRHLASDGLHLTSYGKWSASAVWVQAACTVLGYRWTPLPLRHSYTNWRDQFYGPAAV